MGILGTYINHLGREYEGKIEETVVRLLPKKRNSVYLDCGCDDGLKTVKRAEIIGARTIFGIENAQERAEEAKGRGIKVYKCDLNKKWPLGANSIDCITATEVVEHLFDIDNFFSESKRVLKKGGSLIVSTENLAGYHNIFALLLGNQPYTGPYLSKRFVIGHRPCAKFYKNELPMDPHISVMTTKSLLELFKVYGLKAVNFLGVGFYPFPAPVCDLFSKMDKNHASYVVVKGIK